MTALRHRLPLFVTAVLAVGVLIAWFAVSGGLPFKKDPYKLTVVVPQAASLGPQVNVKIAGVNVGTVTSVKRDGASARVTFEIDGEHSPLPRDSRADVRLRSLVGENFIGITVGKSKSTLASGSTMPAKSPTEYVEVDQILSSLNGKTRERARQLLQGLGGALAARGTDLNHLLEGASDTISDASPVLKTVNGQREQIAHLVDNLGGIMATVGQRGEQVRSTATGASSTFGALAAADQKLQDTIGQLPETLRQVNSTTGIVDDVSRSSSPVVSNIAKAVDELRPAIDNLRPAGQRGRELLRSLSAAAPKVDTALNETRKASKPLSAALPQAQKLLCQLNPALGYIRRYSNDLGTFVGQLGSVANYYDAQGHSTRLLIAAGPNTPGIYTPEVNKLVNTFVEKGLLDRIGAVQGYNPYPAPGKIGQHDKVGLGSTGPADSPRTFTKLVPDC